ncbi:MAG: ERF family protein [bacterium]
METATDVKTDAVQSLEIEKVAGALVAAQGEMTNPPKTKTVYAGQKKYSFAPLPEIIDAVRPVLTKHGLAVVQLVRERMLETRLIHSSGQWIGAAYALPNLADSQDMGSAITSDFLISTGKRC